MTATIGPVVLAMAIAGLAATAIAQIRPMRRLRMLLDSFALVPEWRFFAQASLTRAADYAEDTHLVVRDCDTAGLPGGWQPVLCYPDRRIAHALWNPQARVDTVILTLAEMLAHDCAGGAGPGVQTSMRYLILLRRALEAPRAGPATARRQFAIIQTTGRGARTLAITFLSAWHQW